VNIPCIAVTEGLRGDNATIRQFNNSGCDVKVSRIHKGELGKLVTVYAEYQTSLMFEDRDNQLRKAPQNPEVRLRAWGIDRVLSGDVITHRISVEEGAILKGGVEVRNPEKKDQKPQVQNQAQNKPEPPKAMAATAGNA